jgi:tetratricopeptide (TPR) repeat protein
LETALLYLNKILNITDGNSFDTLLKTYINCYIRLGRYEEALYKLENLKKDINKSYYDLAKTIICKQLGIEFETGKDIYSLNQIKNYSKEEAIKHIIDHHTLDESLSSFYGKEDVEKIYDFVKNNLHKYKPFKTDIFDKYNIPYSSVGFDQNGYCDSLIAIVNPYDLNIITMYPLYGGDRYMEEETAKPKKEVKRLSQIDKFNQRYGKK